MRYVDFKLNEASDLRVKELVKYLGTAGDRVPIFLNKLKSENPVFQTKAGQNIEIKVSQEEITRIEKVLSNPDAGGSLIINTEDGQQINTNTLAKTGEYGGVGANKEGERKIANRGNTMEGVLGAATVARLMKRPGDVISPEDVKRVIQKFPQPNLKVKSNGKTVPFDAVETKDITDKFNLTVKLPTGNYIDFADWDFMQQDAEMRGYINSCIAYVNDANIVGRFADAFENNKRPDEVSVIADGVSDMSGRKTDIFMNWIGPNGEKKSKKFDLSLKAGTTPQFGQASAGGTKPTSRLKAHSEYGWGKYEQIFGDFGINLPNIGEQYMTAPTLLDAVMLVYKNAFEGFKKELQQIDASEEKTWLKTFINNIKQHGTLNDPAVQLAQFEKSGYYVLDFRRLDRLLDKDKLDIDVELAYTISRDKKTKQPKLIFFNKEKGPKAGMFMQIRAKYSADKMNNLIEKGPYLKELTKVRGSK
jgi:hypothetical protein